MSPKRLFDVLVIALITPAILPAILIATLVVLAADGWPPFFFQTRVGKGGRTFKLIKVRTMSVGAQPLVGVDGTHVVSRDDDRLILGGGALRRTSIDELPQVWNVLRGEMSLVGPRPELPEHQTTLSARQQARLSVLPGITGLAQVYGRNDLPLRQRRRLDAFYAAHATIGFDVWILTKTLRTVFGGEGHRRRSS